MSDVDLLSLLQGNRERVELELGSLGKVRPSAIAAEEGLSWLFTVRGEARVALSAFRGGSGKLEPERIVGDAATVTIRDGWGSERKIHGLVAEAEVEPHDVGEATLRYELRPFFYRLSLGRQSRTFHDKDVVEIAREVFAKAGLEVRFEIRHAYAKRAYTAQYRESDFDFVSRLFEDEGIYYWFDHAQGSVLVVADHSPSAPDLDDSAWRVGGPTGALLRYRPELGLESPWPFLRELGVRPRAQPGKITLGSFDFHRPSFKLAAQVGKKGIETYDAPGANVEDPKALEHLAKVRAERARAVAETTKGSSPSVRVSPGRAFELEGHPFARMDGRYVVTKSSFRIDNVGGLGESGTPIDTVFSAVPANTPFHPAIVTPVPHHPGLHSGVVVGAPGEEVHPDDLGRVRLMQHWDREGTGDDKAGRWVRVAQRGTTGSMLLPRVGWNVLSMGEEGSVDLPMVLSRTFDGDHPPPYALPENKTRVAYRTATTPGGGSFNEIRYEDKKGSEEVFVNATKDMDVLVQNVKGEVVHGYMQHHVGANHSLTVGGTYDVNVRVDQKVSVGGNQSEKVKEARQKLVDGNESVKIGGSRNLKTGVNVDVAGKKRGLKVGAAHISATLGEVKSQSKLINQLVGGAVVKATPRKMTEVVGGEVSVDTAVGLLPDAAQAAFGKLKALPGVSKALEKAKTTTGISVQTIGGVKMESGKSRKIEVQAVYSEKIVSGLDFVTKAYADDAAKAHDLKTNELSVKAPGITIRSDKEVVLKCGSTTLSVSADGGIKLQSTEIQLSGASALAVTTSGGKVKVNTN